MRPFSTSTRYQTPCHCLGSRHASCASAVTRSAHIFRLAGQRNQTGLIWPIVCRDERAVTSQVRPADDARRHARLHPKGYSPNNHKRAWLKRRTHFMAIIVSTAERSHQPTGKLPVWLVDVEIDGTRRSMHVTAPDIIEARKAVAKRLRIPFSPS
jgi:hypothetical protein